MNTEMKRRMAESVRDFRLPRYAEIPNVGLYLEQVTKYINGYLAPLGCLEITSSMVSNYVKKGIIPKPVKKQYFAEHISYLFFVVFAKNLVSIENIGLLITMQKNTYTLPVAYDYMCGEMENMIFYTFGLKENQEKLGETESDEKSLLRSLVSSAVNVIHMHACFTQIRSEQEHHSQTK